MARIPVEPNRVGFPGMARGASLHRMEISHVGYRVPAANTIYGRPVNLLLRRRPDDRQRALRGDGLFWGAVGGAGLRSLIVIAALAYGGRRR